MPGVKFEGVEVCSECSEELLCDVAFVVADHFFFREVFGSSLFSVVFGLFVVGQLDGRDHVESMIRVLVACVVEPVSNGVA